MKLGKVSDTILSRSVLKPLNTVRGQKVTRMDIGQDVSEVDIREQGVDKTLLDSLAEYVRNAMGRKTLDVIRVGCTITSHCGENTVGLFLVRK